MDEGVLWNIICGKENEAQLKLKGNLTTQLKDLQCFME